MVQLVAAAPTETPPVASSRAYLRDGLPALYQDGDFGMRFVGALEELLDPIVAMLDALPAHFDPDLAPRDILDCSRRGWASTSTSRRTIARPARDGPPRGRARPPARARSAGLELALELHFPERAAARRGRRRRASGTADREPAENAAASFVVYCDKPVDENEQAAIARCIEQFKPVHTTYRLRVKAAKKKVES